MRPATIALPKRCIFCQEQTKLTREDFFPQWFRELYPAPPESQKSRLNAQVSWHERDPATGEIVTIVAPGKLARPGDLADQTLRIACRPCNNGWMSRLQQAAKPHLVPYIKGHWIRPSRAARKVISSWATMFAMVVEFADEPSAVVPPIEREVFMRDLRPPIGAHVSAGRLAGDLPYWFHQRYWRLTLDPNEMSGLPNAQLTTIVMGHLVLQVYLTTSDLTAFDPGPRCIELGLSPIWPLEVRASASGELPIRDRGAVVELAHRQSRDDVLRGLAAPYRRHESGLFGGG
ncbi:MAG TPA: hypothetical protein VIA98_11320 [Allosphingosinicella sp.]